MIVFPDLVKQMVVIPAFEQFVNQTPPISNLLQYYRLSKKLEIYICNKLCAHFYSNNQCY